ncbi:3-hydroxyacyl-CoA dehydrogenase NAD-binding domain-containing protein [Bradyrhizobium sp. CW1]|uniref:3-hydroxyacyl-CoA dehydrogenase NAD-binding domain-containing protein n=1 Tax=Bradyrhizobium sp. CW1 TaxID=2782686 RepID=UPI001FFFA805|nr:3-hydroxyacyl-CoA dehydrogenase NAD-binding domain-containing protein [Bradyrhizobium sp. CW1]
MLAKGGQLVRIRDKTAKLETAKGHPEIFDKFRRANARKFRGVLAPKYNIRSIEAAVNLNSFEEGLRIEQQLFAELESGPQSRAQRYYFFAERKARKIPDVPDSTQTRPITKVGILGAGTMGGGIAMNFANVGIPVTIVEIKQEALDRGFAVIKSNYDRTAVNRRSTGTPYRHPKGALTHIR